MAVQAIPFAVQSYRARSVALDAQRCVNFYAESEPKDAKSPVGVWGCPGMVPFAQCGAGPVQGMCMMGGVLYVVSGQALYRVDADGSSVELGATWVTGPVSMDTNGTELVWVDGESGWHYSVAGGVQRITDENFYPADNVVYFDTYFVFNRSGTQQFFLSPEGGLLPFDGTQFASKEATADPLLAVVNTHEQLLLFGASRTEVWYDAGNAPPAFPFQRFDGAFIQRGIAGPHAHCLEDNTTFFLGDDGMFYRLSGFQPQRVSTHATEGAWQAYPTMRDARCFSYTLEGHKFVNLLFPSAPASWVFDVATGLWHERESWAGASADSSIGRWRGNAAIMAYGRVLVGDCLGGTVGQVSFQVYTELGATMRGMIVSPPIHDTRRRVFMQRFELDVETGVGLPGAATTRSVAYAPMGVVLSSPARLAHAGAPSGSPASIANLLASMWVCLPDDGGVPGGLLVGNAPTLDGGPGFAVLLADDPAGGGAQVVIRAWDAGGNPIVAASYGYAGWSGWVNVQVSLSPALQQVQVYANDVALVPAGVTWSSALPVANPGAQSWIVAPSDGTGNPPGVLADPAFGGHTAGEGTHWVNTSPMPDQFGNMISRDPVGNVNAVSQAGAIAWSLPYATIQADVVSQIGAVTNWFSSGATPSVLMQGQYLAIATGFGSWYVGLSVYRLNDGAAPAFLGFVRYWTSALGVDDGDGRCFLAGAQTIDDPILMVQDGWPGTVKNVCVFPSISQIVSGAARTGGLGGLYPSLGNTATWAACQVPQINYAYPAALGTNLLTQWAYNGNVGFFLPDGEGGTNHYLYFSRGDMAANAVAGGNANSEIANVIGPACPDGAMVRIAMGAVSYDALIEANFAKNGATSFTATLPMYSIDNANWVNGAGAAQIPFSDEYAYITTGQPGGTDVYGGQPGLMPIPGTSHWLVTFLKVGRSDSQANLSGASVWDTVRTFVYAGGKAVQLGGAVSGEAYAGAADWSGYTLPGSTGVWGDWNAVAYVRDDTVLVFGNMYGTAAGAYPAPEGAQYCTRFGTLALAVAQLADLFIATPPAPVDLSVVANRRLFRSAAGGARYPGADGSVPLGVAPPVFLTVAPGTQVDTFANNGGSGGPFALSGTLDAAESNPPGSTYQEVMDQAANTPVGADPQIMLDWSDDGARTWSALRLCRSMGRQGEYLTRLRWMKLGQARQRVLRLQVTDPVRRNLIGFYLDIEAGMD
ncbi:hypothetical protein [Gluconacetobacter diazotrophicus]|uniref:Uncharacterized protein n=1 Tax=Gluconacetobacter diazotrophicus (strain ATCC 49037 / DSM 5601 / CCUG 37298 / CIP 103539 / LMG 7603 / PAl5) TaxID=272568 RepID=A9H7C6_GLUDA|nr:hypothetical protein [Gluconacetobacter diazotrophicus]CAP57621.1 hypothetical protein GDI3678 [Gluconacetobacter diazotrophicus PA1 5]